MSDAIPSTQLESITLYYREGASDKIYQTELKPTGDGWVVNFAYGRRGNALNTGTKTTVQVAYPKAKAIYDKLVKEKLAKGYTPGEDGARYQSTNREEQFTGILPQLLNPIEEDELESFLQDERYCLQEKFDGKRVMIRKSGELVEGINRNGLVVALPQPIADSVSQLASSFLLDGELLSHHYIAFDLLDIEGRDLRGEAYDARFDALRCSKAGCGYLSESRNFWVAATAVTAKNKAQLHSVLRQQNKEGVVFKDRFAPYQAGRPASGGPQRKFKFYASASFIVNGANAQRSVSLALQSDSQLVPAGNVTIPPNYPIPVTGAVVEVRYLYAFRESGSIYQPTYLGERSDIAPLACTASQLKFKAN